MITDKIGAFIPKRMDLTKVKTYHVWGRKNLVTAENMGRPGVDQVPHYENPEFDQLVDKIVEARKNNRPVIWSMGAHVIKCGLARYIIDLIKYGVITHIASNGAGSIHDFELAYLGGTSEYVPKAIEDGSFGMWEETGAWMNDAIKRGYSAGIGYGESLANYMEENLNRFSYAKDCVLYNAYKMGIPATYQITIGTDIIHQHPSADFAAIGATSGIDFSIFCNSISQLEGGVYMNFGSAVTGPEVFLKALSICRNQGFKLEKITTANFDIMPLGQYRENVNKDQYNYYYRPLKNIVNRPTSLGGSGFYIEANHMITIPNLYSRVLEKMRNEGMIK